MAFKWIAYVITMHDLNGKDGCIKKGYLNGVQEDCLCYYNA